MTNNQALQTNVHNALQWEPSLRVAEIDVTAHEGVVMLTGTVSSLLQKEEASRIVRTIPGIWYVNNELTVDRDYTFNCVLL